MRTKSSNILFEEQKNILQNLRSVNSFSNVYELLVNSGIGKDQCDGPGSPWTAKEIAVALSQLPNFQEGIELRTVQKWEHGATPNKTNIARLARVFAQNEPKLTRELVHIMLAARKQDALLKRKSNTESKTPGQKRAIRNDPPQPSNLPFVRRVALKLEAIIVEADFLALFVGLSAVWALFAFTSIIMGVGSISLELETGSTKTIGFFHSPAWALDKPIVVPIMVVLTCSAVSKWKKTYRKQIDFLDHVPCWHSRILDSSTISMMILAVGFFLIFLAQWAANYGVPITQDNVSNIKPNWLRYVASPDTGLPMELTVLYTLAGSAYNAVLFWLAYMSLFYIYIAADDFAKIHTARPPQNYEGARDAAFDLMVAIYRCCLCALLSVNLIALSELYLKADASSIASWLYNDVTSFLTIHDKTWSMSDGVQPAFYSSMAYMFTMAVPCCIAFIRVFNAVNCSASRHFLTLPSIVITFAIFNALTIAKYNGFAILWIASTGLMIWQIVSPSITQNIFQKQSKQVPDVVH